MQEVGDSLASIEQDLAAVKSDTNDSFSRVSTDVDNTGMPACSRGQYYCEIYDKRRKKEKLPSVSEL